MFEDHACCGIHLCSVPLCSVPLWGRPAFSFSPPAGHWIVHIFVLNAMNVSYMSLCGHIFSLRWIPRNVIVTLVGKFMFKFLKNCQTVFQSGYII